MFTEKVKEILNCVNECVGGKSGDRLPGNVFYMNDGNILCCPRNTGESRYPYDCDGYTLWAHSTGHIQVKNGLLNVSKPLYDNSEPSVEFFAGIKMENGDYFPISILGAAKQLFEPFEVKRYVVYSLSAAYYIADTDFATFAIRTDVSQKKEMRFSFVCINKKNDILNIKFTSYFNPLLRNWSNEDMFSVTRKRFELKGDGSFLLNRDSNLLGIKRKVSEMKVLSSECTNSLSRFIGSERLSVSGAECLKKGTYTHFESGFFGIASEILDLEITNSGRIDYVLPFANKKENSEELFSFEIKPDQIDGEIEEKQRAEEKRFNNFDVKFEGIESELITTNVFNKFIKSVQKQVDNCAMGKYYVGELLGTRDVFQQLEQSVLWDPEKSKEKILRALGYIDPTGRAPRQFAVVDDKTEIPRMDLRQFIDQGNWIISCIYTYITWTNDLSILDEECGYYEFAKDEEVKLCEKRDSVLKHLISITDYLINNLDYEEKTHCLRILTGDWNDSIDGLGKTKDTGKEFGTGVSVMASLHLYRNLYEMIEILNRYSAYKDKVDEYNKIRSILKNGLIENAIDINDNNEKRIIHGWGDHLSYKIGSFCDSDKKSRISFAPNAFWATSGLIYDTPELKEVILKELHTLDSKYGLKTLTPAFTPDTYGVGRIANFVPGTFENDCVYVHASMFSILALFMLGDGKFAWESLMKVIPPTHPDMTKSPFVMSNSYLDNEEYGFKGQSAIDWYTGSGTVFVKNIIRYCIGLEATMEGVVVQTSDGVPCTKISANLLLKGHNIKFKYANNKTGTRRIIVNSREIETTYDEIMGINKALIPNEEIMEGTEIAVYD